MEKIKLLKTVLPDHQPTINEWLHEFKCGSRTPKFSDRAKDMMRLWEDARKEIDFSHTIQKIKI